MKGKKISSNIIYSIVMQNAGFIASLIISPYIARVLSAELIGNYSYTFANSSYFVLAECLGLALYGTIKAAAIRDDKRKLSQLFWEIMYLKILLMFICVAAYLLWIYTLGESDLRPLYYVMLINIIANGIDVTWFLSGLEEFKVIAVRTILVRVINIICILAFVINEEDLLLYALIMQGATLLGYIAAVAIAIKRIQRIRIRELRVLHHLRPSFIYFIPGLIDRIFSATDKSILGLFGKSLNEVGIYEQANKICQLCTGMINAISNVILPRAVYLHMNSKDEEASRKYLKTTIRIAFLAAVPVSIGIAVISDNFVPIFFGSGYEKSASLLKVLCFNILFLTVGNFISQQCLVARGKQKEYNIAISISAVLNVILNLILVVPYQSFGVSIASAVASIVLFIMIMMYSRDVFSFADLRTFSWKYILGAAIMYVAIIQLRIFPSAVLSIALQVVIGAIVYGIVLLIFKDEIVSGFINKLKLRRKVDR